MTGPALRSSLEALGYLTPTERARALNMDRSEYHNMESGKRPVSRYVACQVENLELKARLAMYA